jgi:hypothetical protein
MEGSTNWIASIRGLFKEKIATKCKDGGDIIENSKTISETNEILWRCNLAEA